MGKPKKKPDVGQAPEWLAAELEKTLGSRLKHLAEDDRKALGVMLDAAANKLLHAPTRALKQAAEHPDGEQVVGTVRKLFELPEEAPPAVDEKSEPRH